MKWFNQSNKIIMTLIASNATLAANATDTVQNKYVPQYVSIGITINMTVASGKTPTTAAIIALMKLIDIKTKKTSDSDVLINDVDLYWLGVASQDFHGLMRASIVNVDATNWTLNVIVPIISADGQVDVDWQIDLTNNTTVALSYTVYGLSAGKGKMLFKYQPNILANELVRNVDTGWTKMLVDFNFSQINVLINGNLEEVDVQDAQDFTNLNDEIAMLVVNSSSVDTGLQPSTGVICSSDTGYYFMDNNEHTRYEQMKIQRLKTGGSVNYLMVYEING